MDNIEKINLRLEKLREFVEILKSLKGTTAKDLIGDVDKRAKTERFLLQNKFAYWYMNLIKILSPSPIFLSKRSGVSILLR